MNEIENLKDKLRAKIKEKREKKLKGVYDSYQGAKDQVIDSVLGPIFLNMKPLEEKSKVQTEQIGKQTQAIEANLQVLTNLVEATKLMAKKTIELNEFKNKEKIESKEVQEKEREEREKNIELLLKEVKGVSQKIEEQGKFEKVEKTEINLSDIEDLLKRLNDKEFPEIPTTDLSLIENELKKIANKKVDFKDVTSSLENIYDVLLKAWLPSENAIQVIVKNQVKPGGGGGIIPFQDINRNPVKPLVGADGYLITNTNNVLVDEKYDYVAVTYPLDTTEVYTFKYGGASGDTVATVTIVYVDSTKEYVSTVTKT
jgi:hypothetical protein